MSAAVLVTGAEGFVGRHLVARLGDRAVPADVDVLDADAVRQAVAAAHPSAIVHLAARSAIASSWDSVAETWRVNAIGTLNVLDAARASAPAARVVVVSTGEVYGAAETIPTPEEAASAPVSPYAASKAAAEVACGQAARAYGLEIVVARPFMHIGPGQPETFAVASWTGQVARLEAAGGGTLRVGNLSARRDILDVRDVCAAYELMLDRSVPAGTYNIASGRPVALDEVVGSLVAIARAPIEVEVDPSRLRPADIPVLSGDASRLGRVSGWRATIPLETTVADMLAAVRKTVKGMRR